MKNIKRQYIYSLLLFSFFGFLLGSVTVWTYYTLSKGVWVVYKDVEMDPVKLLNAVIKVESKGNPKATSNKGAIGLMQVRYVVWEKELKKEGIIKSRSCLFKPKENVDAGRYILAKYIGHHGNLKKALNAYSGGAKDYYKKVLEAYMEE